MRARSLDLGAIADGRWGILLLAAVVACDRAPSPSTSTNTPQPRSVLREVTLEVGAFEPHFNGMSGQFFMPEMTGPGGALLDVDRDGDLDLYVVQGHTLPHRKDADPSDRLYLNRLREEGSLRFEDGTTSWGLAAVGYGMGVAVGDVDNDGFPDLYLTNLGEDQLWMNRGGARLEEVTGEAGIDPAAAWTSSASFLDYDRDGWLDLFVTHYLAFTPETHRVCRSAAGFEDYCGPRVYPPLTDRLYRNLGDGRFEDVSLSSGVGRRAGPGLGVVASDLDGDGWIDLYVANDMAPNFFWRNEGDGTFSEEAMIAGAAVNANGRSEASMGIALADFDEDGDEDLFLTHLDRETHTLYRNDGQGLFSDQTRALDLDQATFSATGFGTSFFDYDGDGWLDLVTANGAVTVQEKILLQGNTFPLGQQDLLLRNLEGRGFEDVTREVAPGFEEGRVGRGLSRGDLDDDGDDDLVVFCNSTSLRIFLTESPDAGWSWIRVRALDEGLGRDAIGARVRVLFEGGRTRYRWIRRDGSYASASDPRALFRFPSSWSPEKIVIDWPDGTRSEQDLAGNAEGDVSIVHDASASGTPEEER